MFSRAHSALVEALCHSPKLHHLCRRCLGQAPELYPLQHLGLGFLSQARDFTMFSGNPSVLVEALCHPPELRRIFGPRWKLHNIWRSIFSLGRSSVPLAEAPPRFVSQASAAPPRALSQAGDSTMLGRGHSALVEARPLTEAPPPPLKMSGSSSRIVPTPAIFGLNF
jgi:hypothetical protein